MKNRPQPNRPRRQGPRADARRGSPRQMMPSAQKAVLPSTFSDLSSRIWDMNQVQAYIVATVEDILERRQVPKHRVCSPSLEITIPAIEAMRYSPLRHEIAGLIASTMDADNSDAAHPSFLNILRQLTEDEVRILAAFPSNGRLLPLANVWINLGGERTEVLYRNVAPAALAKLCSSKSRLPQYIDNLLRLQLLHEPNGVKIKDARPYSNLMRQGFCVDLLSDQKLRRSSTLEKRAIALSGIGEAFRNVCLA